MNYYYQSNEVARVSNQRLRQHGSPSNLLHGVTFASLFVILYVLFEATPLKFLILRSFHYSIVYLLQFVFYTFLIALLCMSMVSFYYYFKPPPSGDALLGPRSMHRPSEIQNRTSKKIVTKEVEPFLKDIPTSPVMSYTSPFMKVSQERTPEHKERLLTPQKSSGQQHLLYTKQLTQPTHIKTPVTTNPLGSMSSGEKVAFSTSKKNALTNLSGIQEYLFDKPSQKKTHYISTVQPLDNDYQVSQKSDFSEQSIQNVVDSPNSLYKEPNIHKFLDDWVQNTRTFIRNYVIYPLNTKIQKTVKFKGLEAFSEEHMRIITNTLQAPVGFGVGQSQTPQMQQKIKEEQEVRDLYKEIDNAYNYLKCFPARNFEYVIQRINALARDTTSSAFQLNQNKDKTNDCPSDAQIVLKLLLSFLKSHGSASYNYHELEYTKLEGDIKYGFILKKPGSLFYDLIHDSKRIPIRERSSNIYEAICLLMYLIKKDHGDKYWMLNFNKIGVYDIFKIKHV